MKRFLALLLVLIFALTALVACGGEPEETTDEDPKETEESVSEEATDPEDTDDEPEDESEEESKKPEGTKESDKKPTTKPTAKPTKPAETTAPGGTTTDTDEYGQNELVSAVPTDELDFEGQEIRMLVRDVESYYREFSRKDGYVDQNDLDEAISTRNAEIESLLNISVKFDYQGGTNYSDVDEKFLAAVRNDAGMEGHMYDIVANYAHVGAQYKYRDYWANLNDKDVFPHFNFTMPCWNQSIVETSTINDKLYFISGDLNLTVFDRAFIIWVNKELYDELKTEEDVEDIQDLALEGYWTYATLYDWTSRSAEDTNGKGGIQCNDRHIMETYFGSVPLDALPYSWDIDLVKNTNDGFVEYNIIDNSKLEEGIEMTNILFNNAGVLRADKLACECSGNSNRVIHHFISGSTLFAMYLLADSERDLLAIREMEHKFGILPMPKYDEEQENYGTSSQDAYNLMTVINHNEFTEGVAVSAYLQLANELSYNDVRSYYIERIIKGKTFGTWDDGTVEKSIQIFDEEIADHIEFGFITIYAPQLGNIMNTCWRDAVTSQLTAKSKFEGIQKTAKDDLDKLKAFLYDEIL